MPIYKLLILILCTFTLQGCVHKIVTTPIKVAYSVTKGIVKGTVAVADAMYETEAEKQEKQEKKRKKEQEKQKKLAKKEKNTDD